MNQSQKYIQLIPEKVFNELPLDFSQSKEFKIVNLRRLQTQKQWKKITASKKRKINFRKK